MRAPFFGVDARRGTAAPIGWLGIVLFAGFAANTSNAQTLVWQPQGPGPETQGQVENVDDGEVVGAIQAIAPHPTNANILYVGATNGGIWRTANATNNDPIWVPQTDQTASQSIGALEFDPTDTTNLTLVAGIGRFSSYNRVGGSRSGLLRTTDGGVTWTSIAGGGALIGRNISGVAARGATIVVAASINSGINGSGIWRSTDTGANWTQISGQAGSGLPAGAAFDLVGVTGTPARLYTNSGTNAVYVSTDTGATWAVVSNAAMNGFALVTNVQIATGPGNVVYAAVVRTTGVALCQNNCLAGVFRSGDGGTNWVALDLPGTTEVGGTFFGVHPGGQGRTHLSIAADPSAANSTIVYIGGDRQPGTGDTNAVFPNSIGAENFTGRLFRGDASQPAGTQFVHLTHADNRGPAGGGTDDSSAPHADSRDMVFDANGDLIEGDDGGIYRRTVPLTNDGDWFSMNGNLQNTELHSVAWDSIANVVIGGAQDVGTPDQLLVGGPRWQGLTQADGGVVAVDDISTPNLSTRYFSSQNLGVNAIQNRLNTIQYDTENQAETQTIINLVVVGGGAALVPQFYTPIEINNVDGARMIIGAQNSVYEAITDISTGNVTEIGVGIRTSGGMPSAAIAYGAVGNVDMLYVGGSQRFVPPPALRTQALYVRDGPNPGTLLAASTTYPGTAAVVGIAIDPSEPETAYVVDSTNVFETTDGDGSWNNITGDLGTMNPGNFRSVEYVTIGDENMVVVGADRGVFWAKGSPFTTWTETCSGLPNVPVFDLEYDAADRVLLAGTLGRGAWTCYLSQQRPTRYEVKFVCGIADGTVLAEGRYSTAINLQNRGESSSEPALYRKSFTVGLPAEKTGGKTGSLPGAAIAAGEAVEIDCEDIFQQTGGLCASGFCKGFATIESLAPLDVVAVYTSADIVTQQVTSLHTERVSTDGTKCPVQTVNVASQTLMLVPPHTRGDREFAGHGPCVNFELDLRTDADGTVLTAHYEMQAYECSDDFASPKSDHTSAVGGSSVILQSAGARGRILGHSVDANIRHSYIDDDHADDLFTFAGNEPVQSLRYVGDTSGNEAGTKTKVFVTLRQMDVQMETCATAQ